MISPELTLEESFEEVERMLVAGVAWSIPMEFTLRYSGAIPHKSAEQAHKIRIAFDEQLEDYWSRDTRLAKVKRELIKRSVKSKRATHDVRGDGENLGQGVHNRYYFHEIKGAKFVPLVTTWRYLRCELNVRIFRYENAKAIRGGVLDLNGDLDNRGKAIIDGLRMPKDDETKAIKPHARGLFFCVLEDDRLVTKLTIETREKLGRRPTKTDDWAHVDAYVDVRIFPVGQIKSMNYEMLLP